MSKSLSRRKKVPPAPVSRIGQYGKRPMAKPIKEKRGVSLSKKHVSSFFDKVRRFLLAHYFKLAIVSILLTISFVTFFTSAFAIISYNIKHDEKSGCLTREYIDTYVNLHITHIWSHVFFSDDELRNLHPCLEHLSLQWNPFSPKVVDVIVTARQPVLRVKTQRVNMQGSAVTAAKIFEEPVVSEDTRFVLPGGRLVMLDSAPDIPEISLRYTQDTQVENIAFSQEHVIVILQLYEFLQKEFNTTQISLTDTGIAHFSLPTVQHVYVTLRQDMPSQLGSLQAILSASTIDKRKLFSIDVRSGNAVVSYKE